MLPTTTRLEVLLGQSKAHPETESGCASFELQLRQHSLGCFVNCFLVLLLVAF